MPWPARPIQVLRRKSEFIFVYSSSGANFAQILKVFGMALDQKNPVLSLVTGANIGVLF